MLTDQSALIHEFVISDSLVVTFDAHHSSGIKNGTEFQMKWVCQLIKKPTVTHTNGGTSGINSFAYDTEFNHLIIIYRMSYARDAYKKNNMNQYQLIGEWINLDDGLVKTVDFGISRTLVRFMIEDLKKQVLIQGPTAEDFNDGLFVKD